MLHDLFQPEPDDVRSVTQLTRAIKGQLESGFSRIWVQGEVSNLRRQSSGHVYFSLKDKGSQLPAVLFARDAAAQGFVLEDGMEVVLFGSISVYEPHGRYQLIAKMAIRSGHGRLHLEYERLKKQLAGEGLFDPELKKELPALPLRIAVVSSPTGAAIRDFLRILRRRSYGGSVTLLPARVQGKEAAGEIARMLELAANSRPAFDLVVITRGGGSIEDLWAFNEEALVRAVVNCPLPLVSAVGHEIDTVLTDYAADVRAETPSGAAELISSLYLDACQRLDSLRETLAYQMETYTGNLRQQARDLQTRLRLLAPERRLEQLQMRLDDYENRLSLGLGNRLRSGEKQIAQLGNRLSRQHPGSTLKLAMSRLQSRQRQLAQATKVRSQQIKRQVDYLGNRLGNSSLQASLKRGFALLQSDDGTILESVAAAARHERITAKLRDGELHLKKANDGAGNCD
ncbi:exodeoxyribonuclease VII large subunit [Coraliomargarita parva]|uniref:exodeoxyribonuclease VII large subunit n=1 Tax=Coraliomargarita parva TaxID=3014050 RepID=UPI0022B43457|nr:exodeoxyribonuclease VII large subunit [Coraliomargarita parva]